MNEPGLSLGFVVAADGMKGINREGVGVGPGGVIPCGIECGKRIRFCDSVFQRGLLFLIGARGERRNGK